MKQIITLLLALMVAAASATVARAQATDSRTFLLTGASFAIKENGWFEILCETFNAQPLNRAVSGSAIMQAAMAMSDGTLYSADELERTDAFIIMHVHNQNVAATQNLKDDYREYTLTTSTPYAVAYDYVIRKYRDDCRSLKDNPASAWYGTTDGKPAVIYLCTHWHDGRVTYNQAIRTLADKFRLPLITWDEEIGFSRTLPDGDGRQPSVKFSHDTESVSGVTYGWHPLRGTGQYIQQRMAAIAARELRGAFTPQPPSATIRSKTTLTDRDETTAAFYLTGIAPWTLTCSVNGQSTVHNGIETNPFILPIPLAGAATTVRPEAVGDHTQTPGTVTGEALFARHDTPRPPAFDTYVHQAYTSTTYTADNHLELKLAGGYGREAYIRFNVDSQLRETTAAALTLRAYFYECIYPTGVYYPLREPHAVEIAATTATVASGLTWSTRPTALTPIDTVLVQPDDLGSYISWNVTDYLRAHLPDAATTVTFRLKVVSQASGLLNFHSTESTAGYPPQLLAAAAGDNTAVEQPEVGTPGKESIVVSITTVDGRSFSPDAPSLPPGIYIVTCASEEGIKRVKKFIF